MRQSSLIIGLTGGSGCGKSIVSKAAVDMGFKHIDTDVIGHEIILRPTKVYFKLIEVFGEEILNENNEIDRKKLGAIVFTDSEKLEILNSITHPAITEKVINMIEKYTIIDGAVLYKTPDICKMCDYIIAVTNSDERRIEFITKRDGVDKSTAQQRIQNQPDNNFYSKQADFVIHSDCDIDELYKKSQTVLKRCISG